MKTITINLYSFNELSKEAQQKALNKLATINVEHDWWDDTYEDAKNIGLEIKEFDLDRNKHAKGEFILSANEVAQNIINEHGESCNTNRICESPFPNPGTKEQVDLYLSNNKPLNHPGEDIRAAKAIYEHKHGYVTETNVKEWLLYANEVKEHLNVNTLQEAAEKLELKLERIGK